MKAPAFARGKSEIILRLLALGGMTDDAIARNAGVTPAHVADIRARYGSTGARFLNVPVPAEIYAVLMSQAGGDATTAETLCTHILTQSLGVAS